ncbi:hypothetical protein ACHAQI_009989 [Fusarium lateritium]
MRSLNFETVQGFVETHSSELTNTGTCATLAINASQELMTKHPGVYEFLLYDVGNHKLARCIKTNIVVHSSSREGACFVYPGQEWTRGKMISKWNADGSGVKTHMETGVATTFDPMTPVEALASSPLTVAKKAKLMTFFHSTIFIFS